MICVIADDLTGAAELGAVGLRHGLRAEVVMLGPCFARREVNLARHRLVATDADTIDLLCFDTDSRACRPTEAARRAAAAAGLATRMKPVLIYKKTDSVLRGPVAAEIKAIMTEIGKSRAVLVPANPSRGRVIVNGKYYVNGKPIHLTEFAADPLHPRKTSDVRQLVEPKRLLPVRVCRADDALPETGIVVGEAQAPRDLEAWSRVLDPQTLAAGGADFFSAILSGLSHKRRDKGLTRTRAGAADSRLFVCGSYSDAARKFIARARQAGTPVFPVLSGDGPCALVEARQLDALATEAAKSIAELGRAVLCTGEPLLSGRAGPKRVLTRLIELAERVLAKARVTNLYIEGGATAAALLGRLGWHELIVETEVAPGVVALTPRAAPEHMVTIKPGSYTWPEHVLD
ncbi:MAG: hypothetical protein N2379_05770 [Verrucomicrobiae bacterium]|nr:hypothetical protein [Verrucomicrobiae bacterium]